MQADHPAHFRILCYERPDADATLGITLGHRIYQHDLIPFRIKRNIFYEVFKPAHTGQITMEQMHIYRHQTGLRDVGISVTPEQALLACLRKISEQDA